MNYFNRLLGSSRIGVSLLKRSVPAQLHIQVISASANRYFLYKIDHICVKNMSQKSIKSFFKITPKKSAENKEETQDESPTNSPETKLDENCAATSSPPKSNGKAKKLTKRQREVSSDEGSQSPKPSSRNSSPVSSEKQKKTKRQRIESSESETEAPASPKEEQVDIKWKKTSPKTYSSPKAKKTRIKSEKVEATSSAEKEKSPTRVEKSSTRVEKSPTTVEKSTSPVEKSPTRIKRSPSPVEKSPTKVKKEKKEEPPKERKFITMSSFVKKENRADAAKQDGIVSEEEYNPAKPKYHPVNDACWSKGQEVPYLALAKTFEAIEAISARLKIVEILSNYFRSVLVMTPEDLLPSVYMCLNQLAPAYHSLELGIAETYLMKAIGQCTGRTLAQVKSAAQKAGDLGTVAEQARSTQRTMFAPSPLKARKVFSVLKEIANMTGQASVNKKISKIQTLFTACRHCEAKYLIRSLEGKLRIGLAEQSVLQALALATTLTPPGPDGVQTIDASKGLSPEQFKARVDEQALLIKTTYCECPNYDMIIPAMLRYGVVALPEHCKLTPGIPLKPMLAHPTKGLHEVFNRFENQKFTCEWKYDGERVQIHVPGTTSPDFTNCSIYSRNQENNTKKYPDILGRLHDFLKDDVYNCILDGEAVAYDRETQQILPFQVLSTRKRKDAKEADIKVQVCVFVFDLLYLNGRSLVREPLAERRALLKKHTNDFPGEWQYATCKDCTSMEEVQQFLDDSIKGSCEGLMVKMLYGENARYDIARRSHNWLKLKKDYLDGIGDTIDAVVIGAYVGRGKRAGLYGGFLLACVDSSGEEYQALCKLGTGFSDEDLKTLTAQLKEHVIDTPKNYYRYDSSHCPDVWVEPACVWEVRCADLSLSPAHRAAIGLVDPDKGISLRFPRFIRVRDDKTPEQATSAQQIAEMYLSQDQVKNTAAKVANYDDFY